MQTFYTHDSFTEIAQHLDRQRLNKQALEGWQILMNLLDLDPAGEHRVSVGWRNHPAVKMWRGHELALHAYVVAMVDEWIYRGYKSTIGDKATATIKRAKELGLVSGEPVLPDWAVDPELSERVRASHRRALLVKDYGWYSQYRWPEDTGVAPTEYEYVWPSALVAA